MLRTFYLNNFSTVSELQDVANLIRTILRVERVQQFPAQNVIVMRGTPDQVALAELLINNLDKAKPEVVVDVVVMQVSKTKLKQLGIQYPFQGGTLEPHDLVSESQHHQRHYTTTTGINGSTTPTTSGSGLTLNSLGHLNALDFAVSIPSSSVAFLMSDSNTTCFSGRRLRSVDGQKATLKIGERVPIAVGTSSSTLTATALTQTQFQYQDVGVNIEMTPHIHANGDVSMKISLEVSDIDSYQTIGGLTEPVIGQRKIDHEIRMRDGEVSLIGGMMEHDDVANMSGLPWLASIPGLKYLFGQGQKIEDRYRDGVCADAARCAPAGYRRNEYPRGGHRHAERSGGAAPDEGSSSGGAGGDGSERRTERGAPGGSGHWAELSGSSAAGRVEPGGSACGNGCGKSGEPGVSSNPSSIRSGNPSSGPGKSGGRRAWPGAESGPADGEPGDGRNICNQCDSEWRAECV